MNKNVPQSERAELLLSAAKELFLTHGYEGTSLQMLIDLAGGSRRTIYQEFGNKEGLLKATLLQKVDEMIFELSKINDLTTPHASLTQVCQAFLSNMLAPDSIRIFKLLLNTTELIPDLGKTLYAHMNSGITLALADYLERFAKLKKVDLPDPVETSHLLLAMVKGPLHIQALLDPSFRASKQQIDSQVEKAVSLFLKSML